MLGICLNLRARQPMPRHKDAQKDVARIAALRSRRTLVAQLVLGLLQWLLVCRCPIQKHCSFLVAVFASVNRLNSI